MCSTLLLLVALMAAVGCACPNIANADSLGSQRRPTRDVVVRVGARRMSVQEETGCGGEVQEQASARECSAGWRLSCHPISTFERFLPGTIDQRDVFKSQGAGSSCQDALRTPERITSSKGAIKEHNRVRTQYRIQYSDNCSAVG
jgi:hypothetical protein